MLKHTLVGLTLFLFIGVAAGHAQDQGDPSDLGQQIKALQDENAQLSEKVNSLEKAVYEKSPDGEGNLLSRIVLPEHYYSFSDDSGVVQSGFIRKGGQTGTTDKLLDINLFAAARYTQINNDTGTTNDIDEFSIPFADIALSGQAFTGINYMVQYNFESDRLLDASLRWSPGLGELDAIKDFSVNMGLQKIFLSPAGMRDAYELDFIEYPLLVTHLLPPEARDIGAYFKADLLDQGRLQIWAGIWNGTHRAIPLSGSRAGTAYEPIGANDAWGGGTENNDHVATMARVQVNILDEENLFFMVSSGFETNRVTSVEWADLNANGQVDAGESLNRQNLTDQVFDAAVELRFCERKAWVKGEFLHTYLADSLAETQRGYFAAAGMRLDILNENLDHIELMGRYDQIRLNDGMRSADDMIYRTVGLNYYFDPEHKHDAKLQLNYVFKKDSGPVNVSDNSLLVQFVLGF
ncbi:MAG: hypothetical protein ABIK28_24255 [Planctomycetota bacterium]